MQEFESTSEQKRPLISLLLPVILFDSTTPRHISLGFLPAKSERLKSDDDLLDCASFLSNKLSGEKCNSISYKKESLDIWDHSRYENRDGFAPSLVAAATVAPLQVDPDCDWPLPQRTRRSDGGRHLWAGTQGDTAQGPGGLNPMEPAKARPKLMLKVVPRRRVMMNVGVGGARVREVESQRYGVGRQSSGRNPSAPTTWYDCDAVGPTFGLSSMMQSEQSHIRDRACSSR